MAIRLYGWLVCQAGSDEPIHTSSNKKNGTAKTMAGPIYEPALRRLVFSILKSGRPFDPNYLNPSQVSP